MTKITSPMHIVNDTANIRERIKRWEREVREYQDLSNDLVQDTIKMGVLQDVLVDGDMRRHLLTNAARLVTYEEMLSEVDAYLDACSQLEPVGVNALWENHGVLGPLGRAGKARTKVKANTRARTKVIPKT